jgi:hypothetical protein
MRLPSSAQRPHPMNAPPRPQGQITTFYSYKGGTGRTMLLAKVAWILASAGKRVLAIDWDLEAPGLHHYFHPFLIDPSLEGTDGLIDMVVKYCKDTATPDEQEGGREWIDHAADVRRFIANVGGNFPNGGLLHLLSAGKQDPSFPVRVNTFHWDDFYERLKGGSFLELVKQKIRSGENGYDHILIDSRTGVSDTSGISTAPPASRASEAARPSHPRFGRSGQGLRHLTVTPRRTPIHSVASFPS